MKDRPRLEPGAADTGAIPSAGRQFPKGAPSVRFQTEFCIAHTQAAENNLTTWEGEFAAAACEGHEDRDSPD